MFLSIWNLKSYCLGLDFCTSEDIYYQLNIIMLDVLFSLNKKSLVFSLLHFIKIRQYFTMAKIFSDAQLPKDFAQKLLDCEIEVELNEIVPKNIIMTIFQLYSKGIQYFESIRSYKYMYFQRKMGSLLRCPKIVNSMEENSHKQQKVSTSYKQEKLSKVQQKDEKMRVLEIKQKYEKMHQELMGETTNLMAGDKIKKIVAENQIKLTEVKACINDQLTQQQERLKLKIQRRKFQKATKKCLSAVDLEKSTKDSLFNDSQPDRNFGDKIQTDFSNVIHENEGDSGDQENITKKKSESSKKVDKNENNLLEQGEEEKNRKECVNLLENLQSQE